MWERKREKKTRRFLLWKVDDIGDDKLRNKIIQGRANDGVGFWKGKNDEKLRVFGSRLLFGKKDKHTRGRKKAACTRIESPKK